MTLSIILAIRPDAALHHGLEPQRVFRRLGLEHQPCTGRNRCERIAQVVAEHGDELLTQLRVFALLSQALFQQPS